MKNIYINDDIMEVVDFVIKNHGRPMTVQDLIDRILLPISKGEYVIYRGDDDCIESFMSFHAFFNNSFYEYKSLELLPDRTKRAVSRAIEKKNCCVIMIFKVVARKDANLFLLKNIWNAYRRAIQSHNIKNIFLLRDTLKNGKMCLIHEELDIENMEH